MILAETRELALAAAEKVKITYDLLKPIVTIDEAIKEKSFFPIFGPRIKACENIQDDLDHSDYVISGNTEDCHLMSHRFLSIFDYSTKISPFCHGFQHL